MVDLQRIKFQRDPRGCFVSGRARELASLLGEVDPIMFWPVRFEGEDGESVVDYVSSGGPCGVVGEDWSIPLKAFFSYGERYVVLENGRMVYDAESREDATRWMDERIVEMGY